MNSKVYIYIFTDKKLEEVPSLRGSSLNDFLKVLDEICPLAAILSVVEPFATKRANLEAELKLPTKLGSLFDTAFETFNLDELRKVEIDFNVTEEERSNVQKITLNQSKCSEWFQFKHGRISA